MCGSVNLPDVFLVSCDLMGTYVHVKANDMYKYKNSEY